MGGAVAAGQPLTLTLGGLPHHSPAPRWIALCRSPALIVLGGVWAGDPGQRRRRAATASASG